MTMEWMTVPVEWKAIGDVDAASLPPEWKAKADDPNILVGYASTFGNVDLGGDVVVPGAFSKTLRNVKANGIPLLVDHMPMAASVLGTIFDGKEDAKGLVIMAEVSSAPSAQDHAVKIREGHLSKMSIGYETMDESFEDREVDGMSVRVRLLKEIKLWETSVVVFPMNPEATISSMKALLAGAVEAGVDFSQIETAGAKAGIEVKGSWISEAKEQHPDTLLTWMIAADIERKSGVPSAQPGADPAPPSEGTQDNGGSTPAAGDEPGKGSDEDPKGVGYDQFRSAALLEGRDAGDIDAATRAGLAERLRLNEAALDITSEE